MPVASTNVPPPCSRNRRSFGTVSSYRSSGVFHHFVSSSDPGMPYPMCSWTATTPSSSARIGPRTVFTLDTDTHPLGEARSLCAAACSAHRQQVARVVHEDSPVVLVTDARLLQQGDARGEDMAEGHL